MDGTTIQTHEAGWKEMKLGAIYTTTLRVPRTRPDHVEVRARDSTFVADMADAQTFGWSVWTKATRRGITPTTEVVAIGAGAHWIWNQVAEHFPGAIQIVDWYHATHYIGNVARAVDGDGTDLSKQWAKVRLDDLWEGQIDAVLQALQAPGGVGKPVQDAISSDTNNRDRMRYPEYRAQGLQIGSGSIESGCKHVLGARLKQAGMIWNRDGAVAVAKVRTWLKSGRWDEAIALRPPPQRSYRRRETSTAVHALSPPSSPRCAPTVAAA
jgi:hypothetical protein